MNKTIFLLVVVATVGCAFGRPQHQVKAVGMDNGQTIVGNHSLGTGTGIANAGPGGFGRFGIGLGIGLDVGTPLGNLGLGEGNSVSVGK